MDSLSVATQHDDFVANASGQRLNTLRRTTALALLGIGVISLFQLLLVWFVRGAVVLPLLIAALVTLLGVAGILRRWRFAPGLGALVALAPCAGDASARGNRLRQPAEYGCEHYHQWDANRAYRREHFPDERRAGSQGGITPHGG